MNTIQIVSLIAGICGFQFVVGDCPPERFGLPRLPNSLSKVPPSYGDDSVLQIVGGTQAVANEFPFLISLQRTDGSYYYHICGGSIYSANYIVTAAHCLTRYSASDLRVVAGDHDLTSLSGDEQSALVEQMYLHPDYDASTSDNDIAVLKLKTSLNLNSKVAPIALATTDPSVGSEVVVSGWGTTSSGGSSPPILRKVNVNVYSNTECESAYQNAGYGVTNNMICAAVSGGGKDSCQGDSGGPLFRAVSRRRPNTFWPFISTTTTTTTTQAPVPTPGNSFELVGVVSWGIGCADARYPGVYARVTKYNNYIIGIAGSP